MSYMPTIFNDTVDDILPLAWGVMGGDVTANNLNVVPADGSTSANVSLTNTSIVTNSNLTISTVNNNDSIFIGGAGKVVIDSSNEVNLGSNGSNTTITSGGANGVTTITGGGKGVAVSASNFSVSTDNFYVSGPANFNSPTTFNSTVNFASSTSNINFNGQATFNHYTKFNNDVTFNTYTTMNSGLTALGGEVTVNAKQVTSVLNNEVITANYNQSTSKPTINTVATSTSLHLVNPNITITGSVKEEGIINSDKLVFTNLQYIDTSYIISNNSVDVTYSTGSPISLPFAGTNTPLDSQIANIPISGTIYVDALANNTVVEFTVEQDNQGVLNPYSFNNNLDTALYVALFDNNDNYYNMVLLQGYNDTCLDDANNHCFVKLKDLLSPTDINIQLNTNWKFKLFGVCGVQNRTIPTTGTISLKYSYTIYEPKLAGSGGSSINENNLYSLYDDTSTYNVNDIVVYNDVLYKCITAVTTPEPFDSNKWQNTSLSTEITHNTNSFGGLQLVKMNASTYANLPTYDNNTLYVVIEDNT